MRSPADAPLTAVWMDPPGWTANVRADAAAAPSSTARVMKKRMIFLRAGMHTSACAEGDKVACVIARGVHRRIERMGGDRPDGSAPGRRGEDIVLAMDDVVGRTASGHPRSRASRFEQERVRRMTERRRAVGETASRAR